MLIVEVIRLLFKITMSRFCKEN